MAEKKKVYLPEVAAAVTGKTGVSPDKAEMVLREGFDVIARMLAGRSTVVIPGFGTFGTREIAANQKNVPTVGLIQVPAQVHATFRSGTLLKRLVLNGDTTGTVRITRKTRK